MKDCFLKRNLINQSKKQIKIVRNINKWIIIK